MKTVPKPKRKRISDRKKLEDALDDIWADVVKYLADYKCEYCHTNKNLNSHHVYPRQHKSVRWDIANGMCLCVEHHTLGLFSAHKDPDFQEFIDEKRGKPWRRALMRRKNTSYKKYTHEELEEIKADLIKRIGELNGSN